MTAHTVNRLSAETRALAGRALAGKWGDVDGERADSVDDLLGINAMLTR